MKQKEAQNIFEEMNEDIGAIVENLLEVTWYTADPNRPIMVKAAASIQHGY